MNSAMLTLPFGYHPGPLTIVAGEIKVSPATDLEEIVASIENNDGVEGDWIYAPPKRVIHMGGGETQRPYPSRIFGLPKTHSITHASADNKDHLVFHLWVLSFFTGMRLTATDAGFVDATPIKPGKLFDFVLLGQGLSDAVGLAEAFWNDHQSEPQRPQLIGAIIHALFLGKNPLSLQFERFLLLYTAFDACFALAKSLHNPNCSIPHAGRVAWMCGLFSMPIPAWAEHAKSEVAILRNATVHEALFMDEPLGFALHGVGTGPNLTLEMEVLICRLLVALLGAASVDYVRHPVTTYQMQGLDLVIHKPATT